LSIGEEAVGSGRWDWKEEGEAVGAGVFYVAGIGLMDVERDFQCLFKDGDVRGVIPMGMGEEDHLDGEAVFFELFCNPIGAIEWRVNENGLASSGTAEEVDVGVGGA